MINLADAVRIGLHQLFDEFEEKSGNRQISSRIETNTTLVRKYE